MCAPGVSKYILTLNESFKVKIAVWASLGANFSLCVLQRDYIMHLLMPSMFTYVLPLAQYTLPSHLDPSPSSLQALTPFSTLVPTFCWFGFIGKQARWILASGLWVAQDSRLLAILYMVSQINADPHVSLLTIYGFFNKASCVFSILRDYYTTRLTLAR